jgi:hypothetical protein
MECRDVVLNMLERNDRYVGQALNGLSLEDVHRRVGNGNSIAWLAWHLSRVQDRIVCMLQETEQLWIREGWHTRFGRAADPRESGGGMTAEQSAAFRVPDVKTLTDYYVATRTQMYFYLTTLQDKDLDREVPDLRGPIPLGKRIGLLALECLQHGGQMAYMRGMVKGDGWYKV